MAVIVPLSAIPAQNFQIILDKQDCEITVYTKNTGLFLNLAVGGKTVQSGAIIIEGVSIIQTPNSLFTGALIVHDLWGEDNPVYTGLGDRWVLAYYSANETIPGNEKVIGG